MTYLNIQELQDQYRFYQGGQPLGNNVRQQLAYKDCRSFSFQVSAEQDIQRVLEYFRDRDTDLSCKLPEKLLIKAE